MFSPLNQIAATASLLLAWTNGLIEWILWSISIADFFLFCALGILRRGFGADAFTVPRLLRRIVTVVLCARRSPILVVHYVATRRCLRMFVGLKPPCRARFLPEPLDLPPRDFGREIKDKKKQRDKRLPL